MATIGLIGIGHLARYLVEGYARAAWGDRLLLSPRNQELSAHLAETHDVSRASSNADVVAMSNIVWVTLRPDDVIDVLMGLPWRDDQLVISAAAGVRREVIAKAVHPATPYRAMPVSAASVGASSTVFYPGSSQVADALAPLGSSDSLEEETVFEAVSSLGATYGWMIQLVAELQASLVKAGVPMTEAQRLSGQMMAAAGTAAAQSPGNLDDLIRSLATPKGITEQGLNVLEHHGAWEPWRHAMAAVIRRLTQS